MEYTDDMFKTFEKIGLKVEQLWLDFITAFRPQTIKLWRRSTITQ